MISSILIKALTGIVLRMVTASALEDLLIWCAKNLAKATDSKVDDELVEIIEKHVKGENNENQA